MSPSGIDCFRQVHYSRSSSFATDKYREHVELLERTHALRLQFEHEKGMWMAKIRQDTTDAYIEEQRIHQESFPSDLQSSAFQQSESTDNSADITAGRKFSRCSPEKNIGDDTNRFIYDTYENDHSDFMDEDQLMTSTNLNEEANLGCSRKRKFSTPSRQIGCKAIITPMLLSIDADALIDGDKLEDESGCIEGPIAIINGNKDTRLHNTVHDQSNHAGTFEMDGHDDTYSSYKDVLSPSLTKSPPIQMRDYTHEDGYGAIDEGEYRASASGRSPTYRAYEDLSSNFNDYDACGDAEVGTKRKNTLSDELQLETFIPNESYPVDTTSSQSDALLDADSYQDRRHYEVERERDIDNQLADKELDNSIVWDGPVYDSDTGIIPARDGTNNIDHPQVLNDAISSSVDIVMVADHADGDGDGDVRVHDSVTLHGHDAITINSSSSSSVDIVMVTHHADGDGDGDGDVRVHDSVVLHDHDAITTNSSSSVDIAMVTDHADGDGDGDGDVRVHDSVVLHDHDAITINSSVDIVMVTDHGDGDGDGDVRVHDSVTLHDHDAITINSSSNNSSSVDIAMVADHADGDGDGDVRVHDSVVLHDHDAITTNSSSSSSSSSVDIAMVADHGDGDGDIRVHDSVTLHDHDAITINSSSSSSVEIAMVADHGDADGDGDGDGDVRVHDSVVLHDHDAITINSSSSSSSSSSSVDIVMVAHHADGDGDGDVRVHDSVTLHDHDAITINSSSSSSVDIVMVADHGDGDGDGDDDIRVHDSVTLHDHDAITTNSSSSSSVDIVMAADHGDGDGGPDGDVRVYDSVVMHFHDAVPISSSNNNDNNIISGDSVVVGDHMVDNDEDKTAAVSDTHLDIIVVDAMTVDDDLALRPEDFVEDMVERPNDRMICDHGAGTQPVGGFNLQGISRENTALSYISGTQVDGDCLVSNATADFISK